MGGWHSLQIQTSLCPADYFGRTLVAALPQRIRVGVLNVSVAGCKIELFDKDTDQAYAATAPSWMADIIEQYGGRPYQHLVDMARVAQRSGVIKGILLHQGESNANDTAWPDRLGKIYRDLLADLNLEAEAVPLLAGETVNADQGGVTAAMNALRDRLHFSPAGYRELGRHYGEQMLRLS